METLVSQMEYEDADGSTQKSKYFKYPVELSRPITLDGKFEEKAWNKNHKFNKRPLHAYLYGERCTKNDLSANYQIAWNKDNLYFALDIQDDKLVPISWKGDRAVGDFVQLDLDFETELMKTGALAEEFSKKHVSLAIGFFDREGNAKVYDLNSGKEVEGVGVAYSKTKTGYAVEIELPSKTIKTILNKKRMKNPLRSGKDILFTISVADADVIESGEAQHVKASASMDETKPFQAGRISLYRKYKTKNIKSIITNK